MPLLRESGTGREVFVSNENLQAAIASGRYDVPDDLKATVQTPAGRVVEAPADAATAGGARPLTEQERLSAEQGAYLQEEHGGAGGKLLTGVEEFVSAASGGLYDVFGRSQDPEFARRRTEQRQVNPGTAMAGGLAGSAVGIAASGGGALGAVARATPAGKAATLAGGGIRGAAAEGLVVGGGEGLTQAMIDEDPLTIERVLGSVSSNALLGAGTGLAVAGAGKALERGLTRARAAADDARSALAKRASVSDDMAGKDRATLRAERQLEVERLAGEQVGAKAGAADNLAAYRSKVEEANPWLAITEGDEARLLNDSARAIKNALKDPKGLQKSPGLLLKPLRVQEQAFEKAIGRADEIVAKLDAKDARLLKDLTDELATLPDAAEEVVLGPKLASRYGASSGVRVSKGKSLALSREEAEQFLQRMQAGEVSGESRKSLQRLGDLLEENRAYQKQIEATLTPKNELASQRLVDIDGAIDALSDGGKKAGILEQAVQGSIFGATIGSLPAIPVVGPIVAPMVAGKVAGAATDLIFGRMGKAAGAAAERTAKAVDAFLDVAGKAQKVAPPLATKVLTSVRFGDEDNRGPGRPRKDAPPQKGSELVRAFKARETELRKLVTPGPDGRLQMTRAGRQRIADSLRGVAAQAPMLADKLETAAARKVEFLASKLPRRPDIMARQLGPDTWRPADMEMRKFARYVAAVEDPGGVEERLVSGTVTPEDAEAYKTVYPERFEALKADIINRLPELQQKLPYKRRLALSIFTGVPVDPAFEPRILRVLQGQYAEEPNTDGGTTAPRPQPQFGSVTRPQPTPAQERAAGA